MRNYTTTGLSLPQKWMERIDIERGDISRSRYVLRILEKAYGIDEKAVKKLQNPKFRVDRSVTKDSEVRCTQTASESDSIHEL